MKSAIWRWLAPLILLAACQSTGQEGDFAYPPVQPPAQVETLGYPSPPSAPAGSPTSAEPYPSEPLVVTWEEAKSAILKGNVVDVIQLHSLTVNLVLQDGSQLTTEEPAIDDVLEVIDQCGQTCENIQIVTE